MKYSSINSFNMWLKFYDRFKTEIIASDGWMDLFFILECKISPFVPNYYQCVMSKLWLGSIAHPFLSRSYEILTQIFLRTVPTICKYSHYIAQSTNINLFYCKLFSVWNMSIISRCVRLKLKFYKKKSIELGSLHL